MALYIGARAPRCTDERNFALLLDDFTAVEGGQLMTRTLDMEVYFARETHIVEWHGCFYACHAGTFGPLASLLQGVNGNYVVAVGGKDLGAEMSNRSQTRY